MLGLGRTSHRKDMDPSYQNSKWLVQRTTQLGPIGISLGQNSLISDKKFLNRYGYTSKNSTEDGTLKISLYDVAICNEMYPNIERDDMSMICRTRCCPFAMENFFKTRQNFACKHVLNSRPFDNFPAFNIYMQ